MNMNDYLFRLNFMVLLDLDAEALNNSGTNGNVLETRTIQLKDGLVRNAITGNMVKHIFVKHLRELAEIDELCDTCKLFSPMKNGKLKHIDERFSLSGNRVRECVIDDVTGFMNAGKNTKNEKRKSPVSFSWAIAKRGTRQESVLYTRVDPTIEGGSSKEEKKQKKKNGKDEVIQVNEHPNADIFGLSEALNQEEASIANTNDSQNTQMIFYRPIRSSEFALAFQLDLHRIGFDDERQVYVLEKENIKRRIRMVLKAVENTLLNFDGALCGTNLPHVRGIKGIVTEKTDRFQRITKFSPLNDNFMEQNEKASSVSHRFEDEQGLFEIINRYTSEEFLDAIVERNMKFVENF
jgi:CRISPR-associated protein Cst2